MLIKPINELNPIINFFLITLGEMHERTKGKKDNKYGNQSRVVL